MKRKILIQIVLLFLCTLWSRADDAVLNIDTKCGVTYRYLFSEQPILIPDEQMLTVNCGGYDNVMLNFIDVVSIKFSDNVTFVSSPQEENHPMISIRDGILTVADATSDVRVYNTNGQLVGCSSTGTITIRVQQHTTYIVHIGRNSFKVMSK